MCMISLSILQLVRISLHVVGDETILPRVVEFLQSIGRMKYIRPLYRLLYQSGIGKTTALDTFKSSRQMYHPVAAKMVAADLGL